MNLENFRKKISLQNSFLFCTLILLPLSITYVAVLNLISESFYYQIESAKDQLKYQNAKIAKISSDKYQITDFLDTVVNTNKISEKTPEQLKIFFDKLEDNYPDAFKWLVFSEDGTIVPVQSKSYMPGRKSWNYIAKAITQNIKDISNPYSLTKSKIFTKDILNATSNIQRSIGGNNKIEHLFTAWKKAIDFHWLNQPCYVVWDAEATKYENGFPAAVKGGAMLFVFQKNLPKYLWVQRMITRKESIQDKLKLPIIAINLNKDITEFTSDGLPDNDIFATGLIKAYKNRSSQYFHFNDYLMMVARTSSESDLRIISAINTQEIIKRREKSNYTLNVVTIFILISALLFSIFANWEKLSNISLKKRIACIFITAVILPLISLVSIGRSFIIQEEIRLKESAIIKMRNSVDAMDLRYRDTPRIVERNIYETLLKYIGAPPYDRDKVLTALDQAIKNKIIENYILTNMDGTIDETSWVDMDNIIKRTIALTVPKRAVRESIMNKPESLGKALVDEELNSMMELFQGNLDFSRPSYLRYFAYQDKHMYFMDIHLMTKEGLRDLIIQIPEYYLERMFAVTEFSSSRFSLQKDSDSHHPELSFYSIRIGEPSYPEYSPLWDSLKRVFERSFNLKTEETGTVTVDNEDFIYLIKPLNSMKEQTLIPCILTSTGPIYERIKGMTILIIALILAAFLGTILLSLSLTSSLLEPIKVIDQAASRVGQGDLSIMLPFVGTNEIGRLSQTFNRMVRGLREHRRMQAYVSDSVKEAIESDEELREIKEGKNIEATVLFSDIRNFTGITEKNPPVKVFELLNSFFGGVEPIIRMNYGRVDKYIGDAVMAIFRHNSPEHHALSAVKTAVMMMKYLKYMNQIRVKRGMFPIAIGIGISTGKILLGDLGSSKRKDLTVIGDEVNLASRLETASKQGRHTKIVFSGSTYEFIKDKVVVEKMPFNEVRGKTQTIEIYELIKMKDD